MRLLTVTHFYETHGGGIERVAGQLNRELALLGHEIAWAASDGDAPPGPGTARAVPLACWNGIERFSGLPMPIPTPGALRRLRDAVRAADAVIVHDALYATSVAALRTAHKAGKPVLLVQHIAAIPFRNPLLRAAMRLGNALVTRPMLKAAEQVVYISETTAAHFAGLALKRPAITAFNGVDTAIFHPGTEPSARGAGVLFVGRFVEKKGLSVIRALAARRPDISFVLAGSGPIDPAGWGLANVAVRRGLSGEALADLYRGAGAFLLPSVGEGYPLVIQEALACGLPVVCGAESAAADPAAARFMEGRPVDLADPEGTAEAFAPALDAALASPPDPGRAAFARDHYSWTGAARRYDDALSALVPASRS